MNNPFEFEEDLSIIHRLSGLSKLISFLILTTCVMLIYDIRAILLILVLAFIVFKVAKLKLSRIKGLLIYLSFFLMLDFVLTFLFAPEHGVSIYGTRTVLFEITDRYVVTKEQLLYQVTKLAKYFATIPFGLIFFYTTNPSEFASSLNKIKVPYKIAYTFALTLRYIPDMTSEFRTISKAQQARGLDLSKDTKFRHRVKQYVKMILPIIFSTLDRVDGISNAMELRGFGKNKKRTWYSYKKLTMSDYITITFSLAVLAGTLYLMFFVNGGRFWNPFV